MRSKIAQEILDEMEPKHRELVMAFNDQVVELADKDNEISRLNGIITEQARLSELVSGDLQKAQKEIQELMENISELDKLKLDTLINLRIENASLRADLKKKEDHYMGRIASVLAENDNLIIEKNALRADRADYEKLKDSDKALIFELNTEMIRLRAEVERLNLIVKQLTNPVSIGTFGK